MQYRDRTKRQCARTGLKLTSAMAIAAGLLLPAAARADDAAPAPASSGAEDFFQSWFDMATRSQNEQPHWMTPLVTVTPRLEQEVRYDQFLEKKPSGADLDNFDAGKGVEIIPTENTELIFGVPPYETRSFVSARKPAEEGWADWPFLLAKYRLASANEQQGNYIVTGFLQFSAPTGGEAFTNGFYIVQPTIAAGKGWGDFDIQATLSEQFPFAGQDAAETSNGKPILANVTAQYHLVDILWPELEANYTYWPDGTNEGKSQVFLTPGIIFGRFPIQDRVKLIVGVGYQMALSPHDPSYNRNLVLTARTTF